MQLHPFPMLLLNCPGPPTLFLRGHSLHQSVICWLLLPYAITGMCGRGRGQSCESRDGIASPLPPECGFEILAPRAAPCVWRNGLVVIDGGLRVGAMADGERELAGMCAMARNIECRCAVHVRSQKRSCAP